MADTFVTLNGWVGNDVTHREAHGVSVVNFRLASTPRIKRKGEWMDGETTWYSVNAWRNLADNVRDSVSKGDALIVHGRLRTEHWKREDGVMSSSLVVEASLVGHDLTRGTSGFRKSVRPERPDSDVHEELSEIMQRDAEEEPAMDSWGNPRQDENAPAQDPFAPGQQPAA